MTDGIIGARMTAHKILPGAKTILRISVGLSDKAKQRSKWIDWYFAHGLKKVLVSCTKSNLASVKTILKNGGVLEDERVWVDGSTYQRYWIDLL